MSRKLFAVVLGCALLAPVIASAHPTQCSPGFWKNHPEVWYGMDLPRCQLGVAACCAENIDSAALLAALNTGGACPDTDMDGDPDCPRHDATEFLNACFVDEWVSNPCPGE
jgi:hypothetical protein